MWYSWTPSQTGDVTIDCDRPRAALVAIYDGTALADLEVADLGQCTAQFHAEAGRTYKIAVAGNSGGSGTLSFDPGRFGPAGPLDFGTVPLGDISPIEQVTLTNTTSRNVYPHQANFGQDYVVSNGDADDFLVLGEFPRPRVGGRPRGVLHRGGAVPARRSGSARDHIAPDLLVRGRRTRRFLRAQARSEHRRPRHRRPAFRRSHRPDRPRGAGAHRADGGDRPGRTDGRRGCPRPQGAGGPAGPRGPEGPRGPAGPTGTVTCTVVRIKDRHDKHEIKITCEVRQPAATAATARFVRHGKLVRTRRMFGRRARVSAAGLARGTYEVVVTSGKRVIRTRVRAH